MVIPLLGMALLTACGSSKESTQQDVTEVVEETQEQTGLGEDNRYTQTGNLSITDNDALYEQMKDDQVVVVDFKFGKENPKYNKQVKGYMQLLTKMGYKNITGYLWYVDEELIVKVK